MGWGWGGIIPFLGLPHEDAATLMMGWGWGWDGDGVGMGWDNTVPWHLHMDLMLR